MDYEKKYKSALKKLKPKMNDINDIIISREDIGEIFPELKESDGERIRKEIINYFRCQSKDEPYRKTTHEKWIAWLEKHKLVEHLELKAGHWYACYRAYCCRADSLTIREGERFMCEKDGVVKGFVIKDAEKYFKECNAPAPYENEQDTAQFKYIGSDEVRRRSTIQVLEYARSLDDYNQYGKADIDKNIAWLEKQGEQKQDPCEKCDHFTLNCHNFPCIKKKAFDQSKSALETINEEKVAWSEEDEKIIQNLLSLWKEIMIEPTCCRFGLHKDKIVEWLKSLKDKVQPKWKPSDEQMKALSSISVTGNISYAGQGQKLIDLYNDLKKLKEE